uniref:Uncharacterized protein n=1 Tax=Rousettus aegyptiacus TaxID=9407 RepID=A0A7J8KAY0_ROUAE|nr:hypothetical protein HJG63_007847 [Rousettus aegyptiacus]
MLISPYHILVSLYSTSIICLKIERGTMTVFKFHSTQLTFTDVSSGPSPAEPSETAHGLPHTPFTPITDIPNPSVLPSKSTQSLASRNLKIFPNRAFLLLDIFLQIPFLLNSHKVVASAILHK